MEIQRVAAASTYVVFPMLSNTGVPQTGLTVTGTWLAWADTARPASQSFRPLSGAVVEIDTSGVYQIPLASTELPAASPYVILRLQTAGIATQYLLLRTATFFANVSGINGTTIATPATAGYMPMDVKQPIALTSMADNSVEKALARVYFATDYLDVAVSSRLAPTVAARTLDVSAGGEAGVDWANVGSPTSTVGLSGTTVGIVSSIDTGGIAAASFAAGAVDASALAANAIGASELAADAVAEIADGVWDEDIYSAHQTDNTAGKALKRIYHATDYLDAKITTIGSTYADDFLGRTLTRGASGGRTVGQSLMALRNKVSISAGTLTVTSNDDTTSEWTATVATQAVTAIVTSIDPA